MNLVVFLVIAVASTKAISPEFALYSWTRMDACEQEFGLPTGTLETLLAASEKPTNDTLSCAVGCYFTSMGTVKDGAFDANRIHELHHIIYANHTHAEQTYQKSVECIDEITPQERNNCTFPQDGYFCVVGKIAKAGLPKMYLGGRPRN